MLDMNFAEFPFRNCLEIRDRSRMGAPRATNRGRMNPDSGASCRQRGAVRCLRLFSKLFRKGGFCEVHGRKRPLRRIAKHSTTAWRQPFGVKTLRLGTIRCTNVYQGVATRNSATTLEILAHRTGAQPNFALRGFSEPE